MPPNTDHPQNKHMWTILCNFSKVQVINHWWWILCDPKHIGVIFNVCLLDFYTTQILMFTTVVIECISWLIKVMIIMVHGGNLKLEVRLLNVSKVLWPPHFLKSHEKERDWHLQWFLSTIWVEMMQRHNFVIQVILMYKWDTFFINLWSFREVNILLSWGVLNYYQSHQADSSLSSWKFLSLSGNSPQFVEPKCSLPYPQVPPTCP